jgi:hypothetical protein
MSNTVAKLVRLRKNNEFFELLCCILALPFGSFSCFGSPLNYILNCCFLLPSLDRPQTWSAPTKLEKCKVKVEVPCLRGIVMRDFRPFFIVIPYCSNRIFGMNRWPTWDRIMSKPEIENSCYYPLKLKLNNINIDWNMALIICKTRT